MINHHIYSLIEPVDGKCEDTGEHIIVEFIHPINDVEYRVAVIGENEIPKMVRIIFQLETQEYDQQVIHEIKQFVFSILRMLWYRDFKVHPFTFSTNPKELLKPELSLIITPQEGALDKKLDVAQYAETYNSAWTSRSAFGLFTEGVQYDMPIYYKFLSMYRIVELGLK
ncbi:hypothetical protein ACWJJH_01290 [Endozoicomonadaceae bacterium StTr2]